MGLEGGGKRKVQGERVPVVRLSLLSPVAMPLTVLVQLEAGC